MSHKLAENSNWGTRLFNKRVKYQNKAPHATAVSFAAVGGNSANWVEQNTNTTDMSSGSRDGDPPGFDPRTAIWQQRQLHPPRPKEFRRHDMINPYWQTSPGPLMTSGINVEMLVNNMQNPLPFSNDNFQQIEAQARDERYEAYTDPLSARYAAYDIHPDLAAVEIAHRQGKKRNKPANSQMRYHSAVGRSHHPMNKAGLYGYGKIHTLKVPNSKNENFVRPPIRQLPQAAPAGLDPTGLGVNGGPIDPQLLRAIRAGRTLQHITPPATPHLIRSVQVSPMGTPQVSRPGTPEFRTPAPEPQRVSARIAAQRLNRDGSPWNPRR